MTVRWDVFSQLLRPVPTLSWAPARAWTATVAEQIGGTRDQLAELRAWWDVALADVGGDPSARDWSLFRALRRDREEDWSDWLGQLLEDSASGALARRLIGVCAGGAPREWRDPVVHREVLQDAYRADLIVEWVDGTYTHVEVKVGDPNLAKTLPTSHRMERRFGSSNRREDIVLLLPAQASVWRLACDTQPGLSRVGMLTWLDVARALRESLADQVLETIAWRVWARAFCGAIEQDLLGLRAGRDPKAWANAIGMPLLDSALYLLSTPGPSHVETV